MRKIEYKVIEPTNPYENEHPEDMIVNMLHDYERRGYEILEVNYSRKDGRIYAAIVHVKLTSIESLVKVIIDMGDFDDGTKALALNLAKEFDKSELYDNVLLGMAELDNYRYAYYARFKSKSGDTVVAKGRCIDVPNNMTEKEVDEKVKELYK